MIEFNPSTTPGEPRRKTTLASNARAIIRKCQRMGRARQTSSSLEALHQQRGPPGPQISSLSQQRLDHANLAGHEGQGRGGYERGRFVPNSHSDHEFPQPKEETINIASTKSELEKLRRVQDAWNRRNEVTDDSGHTEKVRKMWLKPYMVNILSY